jgi:uncharacterized Zn finger protein
VPVSSQRSWGATACNGPSAATLPVLTAFRDLARRSSPYPEVVMPELSSVLSEAIVQRLASRRSLERGMTYLDEGRVGPLRVGAVRVNAMVQGSESYAVELHADEGGPRFACSCPVGVEGEFCKHCVAVALSWLKDRGLSGPTLDDARTYLEGLPPRSLVELLVDHAHEDERLARRILLMTARSRERAPGDLDSLRVLIDRAIGLRQFSPTSG